MNEFTPSGWFSHATDEYVELRNTSDEPVALNGWVLVACLSPSSSQVVTVFNSTAVVPSDGFLLLAHVDYEDGSGGTPNGRYDVDVPEDGGWLLRDPWSGYADGVGLAGDLVCTEGDPAPQCDWASGEAATRNQASDDTDDNSVDFACRLRSAGS